MSIGREPGHLHPVTTQRSSFRYFFYDKHHGRGGPEAARWLPELTDNEEFAIFEQADLLELSDERGNLYGMRIGPAPDREVRDVGTHRQQVAKFPFSRREAPWHGFPLGPMEKDYDPPRPPRRALPRDALTKMVASGLLNMAQLKRLVNGRNI
jgi:hypothetical protein